MCFGGDVYNTTINFNGRSVYSSWFSPCCCNMRPIGWRFGYGRHSCFSDNFMNGLGFGIGFGTAMFLPSIIANLCSKNA